jgi:hypothetical protein
MSRRNFKRNLVALLACTALLLASLGCESVTGPSSTSDSSPSTSGGPSFSHNADDVNG